VKNPDANAKKTNNIFLAVLLILAVVISFPVIVFFVTPSMDISTVVLDKTGDLHHAGIRWFLKAEKSPDSEFYGHDPETGATRDIGQGILEHDLLYIADTYGIYKEAAADESSLVYGGLTHEDLSRIYEFLAGMEAKTIIAEYNSFADPTHPSVQAEAERLFAISSSGWTGSYIADLSRGKEVPGWAVRRYENRFDTSWDYSGPGFLFTDDTDRILVLRLGEEIGGNGCQFTYTEEGTALLGLSGSYFYNQPFEITTAARDAQVLASFELDLTDAGKELLDSEGLPSVFPAVITRQSALHRSTYLAGNFAYLPFNPKFHRFSGVRLLMEQTAQDSLKGEYDFYWAAYLDLMEALYDEAELRAGTEIPKDSSPVDTSRGVSLKARTEGRMLQVYTEEGWEDLFIHGMNLGTALPGRWFTQFPREMGLYYRWLEDMAAMGIDTLRIYTLLNPQFYTAFSLYNRLNPNRPLYLLQEIWPEEYPPGEDYIRDAYRKAFWQEIIHVVDAIHGKASIEERFGRAWGEYTEDVSAYVIGYLVGRELEPHEVETTDENNPDFTFSGSYLRVSDDASATEAWLAESTDYTLSYESSTYGWQHPVAIVNWPTLDPLVHESERDEQGKKVHEFNDYMSVDINNLKEGSSMIAGLFGAYHIYPNYPDFMNNDPKYDEYIDEQGRFRYGGYLRQFIEQHTAYPAVVAEFGLATGSGNAHTSPDGYHHGSMTETVQGDGIIRMFEAMKREDYAGGIIFEWMDEWAKKTWTTEPYMIPYDRQILWHNTIDPEQNYGILAFEAVKPAAPEVRYEHGGIIETVELTDDISFLYIDIDFRQGFSFDGRNLYIGLDTYERDRGEIRFLPDQNYVAASGLEFLIKISEDDAELLVIPPYNSDRYRFSTYAGLNDSGEFEQKRKLINKKRMLPDGTIIETKYEDAGALFYGPFEASRNHWYMDGNTLSLRIPWTRINVADPSSAQVLDDAKTYYSDPLRDVIEVSKTEGIAVSLLLTDEQNRKLDILPEQDSDDLLYARLEGWNYPVYRERLKESYPILQEYLQTDE
jgi:hypothetical protein